MILILHGQIRGGKNNVQITRTGRRYPNANFAKWRDDAVRQLCTANQFLNNQGPMRVGEFCFPYRTSCEAIVDYTPGDLKVRDVPAMMDALWSVLVKAGLIADDGLIRDVVWREHPLNRQMPMCRIELRKL